MPKLVCTEATLACSFGDTPATFSATGTQVSARSPAGVVADVAAANVPPFGQCWSPFNPRVQLATDANQGKLTAQPCEPVLSAWSRGSARVTIGGIGALDDSSQCDCAWHGVVTVTDAGQTATSL